MSYYQIKNGKAEQVTELPNVSGVELFLSSLSVADRQARGIYGKMFYSSEVSDPVADASLDTIFAPMPPEPAKEPLQLNRFKLIEALDKRGLLSAIDAYMAHDARARWYFTTATVIEENHPLLVSAIATLKAATGLTDADVQTIYNEATI